MSRTTTAWSSVHYLYLILIAIGLLSSQLLLKSGLKGERLSVGSLAEFGGLIRQILTSPVLLAGYAVSGLVAVLWLVVLSRMDLSYANPMMTAIYYVLLMLASTFLLHEHVSPWRVAGTLLIVAGIALMSKP